MRAQLTQGPGQVVPGLHGFQQVSRLGQVLAGLIPGGLIPGVQGVRQQREAHGPRGADLPGERELLAGQGGRGRGSPRRQRTPVLATLSASRVTDGRAVSSQVSEADCESRKVMVMRVFVAGGTGVVGRRLVPQLVARGHQVTATTTSAAKLDLLEPAGRRGRRDGRAGCGVGR